MSNVSMISMATVEERSSQRTEGDVADLQAHQTGEAGGARSGAGPPAQIPAGHLRSAEGQNGPAQVNGQRQHHHRHGQGNPSSTLSVQSSPNFHCF